ncbi:hypothetical protein Tco_0744813 [Tanacetum coccineum]
MKQNLPLQLEKRVYPPSGSQTVDLVLNHRKYKVLVGNVPLENSRNILEMYLYGYEWWKMMNEGHTSHGRKDRAFYKKLTAETLENGLIVMPSNIMKTYKLYGYASAIVMNRDAQYEFELCWGKVSNSLQIYSSPILRKMKEMTGFMADQWARFYLTKGTSLKDGVIRLDVC